jgi:hypothetical protein
MAVLQSILAIALLGRQACAYTWPNPLMEILDATRKEQLGPPGSARLGFDVVPCNPSIDLDGADSGRTNAADWLRTVSSLNHSRFCLKPRLMEHRPTMTWPRMT